MGYELTASQLETKRAGLVRMLEVNANAFEVALPDHMRTEVFSRSVQTYFLMHPELFDCQPLSIAKSLLTAAQCGLYPDGTMGSAYLVKYGRNCTLVPGYRGLLDLMRRSGNVAKVEAHVVYDDEHFMVVQGTMPRIEHQPNIESDESNERGWDRIVAAYAVVWFTNGTQQFEVLDKAELAKIRNTSLSKVRNKEAAPWSAWPKQMARKTAIRRLAKYVPQSPRLAATVRYDEALEQGDQHGMDAVARAAPVQPIDPRPAGERVVDAIDSKAAPLDMSALDEWDGGESDAKPEGDGDE